MIVYSITNTVSGKRYFGLTESTLKRRWWSHMHALKNGVRTALYDAMRHYGVEAFVVQEFASLLPGMCRDDLSNLERKIIAQEQAKCPHGYNMTDGGDGVMAGSKRVTPSPLKGKPLSLETRAKMSAVRTGKKWSDESRQKLSATNRGIPRPHKQETKDKIKASFTPERREELSDNMKRCWSAGLFLHNGVRCEKRIVN